MNKKGFGFIFAFIMILVAVVLLAIQNGMDSEATINATNNVLNWSNMDISIHNSLQNSADTTSNEIARSVILIADKMVDVLGYISFEVAKLAVTFAGNNSEVINANLLITLVLLFLLAPLIYPTFIIIVSLILIFREWRQKHRDKRDLEKKKVRFNEEK